MNRVDTMSEPSSNMLQSPDAGSRTAGEIIRAARLAQNLTLDQLADAIKVTVAKLSALEAGRFDELPNANFTRALAMTLCRTLKIDSVDVLAGLPAAQATTLVAEKPPLNQPFKDVRRTSPLFDHGFAWGSLLSFKWMAPLLLLLAAAGVYLMPEGMQLPVWMSWHVTTSEAIVRDPEPAAANPVASEADLMPPLEASSAAENALAPAFSQPPASASAVNVRASDSTPSSTLSLDVSESASSTASGAGSTVEPALGRDLVVSVAASSWVEVRDAKGEKLINRQVEPGETVTLQGRVPIKLNIGNADGVKVIYGGVPIDLAPSTRGNVARLELK